MPRYSVLERVARKKTKQEQRRKRIGHGKWVGRFAKRRQAKRICNVGSWNTRQLGARTGYVDQDLKLDELIDLWELRKWEMVTLVDTKLGTHATLETQSSTQPKWTLVSRGRVCIALNEPWALAWRNDAIQVNTDGKGEACRSMLLQIPCFQKLGISIVATYAPSTNVTAEEQQTYLDDLEALIAQVSQTHPHHRWGFQRRGWHSGPAYSSSRTPWTLQTQPPGTTLNPILYPARISCRQHLDTTT